MELSVGPSTATIVTEIFPILSTALPPLVACQAIVRNGDFSTIAAKVSFRLQRTFSGHWVSTGPWIITDAPLPTEDALKRVVESLWSDQDKDFQGLLEIQLLPGWRSTPQAQADFVARGLWSDLKATAEQKLRAYGHDLSSISIVRTCQVRGWDVQGEPAISISIDSQLLTKQNVQTYLSKVTSSDAVIDLMVADRETSLKGTISSIVGPVKEHRKRLMGYSGTSAASKTHMQKAGDEEFVVQVIGHNRKSYDYVARGLSIIIRTSDYAKFGVNGRQVTPLLRLTPQQRSNMVKEISTLFREKGLIGPTYSSIRHPHLFLRAADVCFTPGIQVGHQQKVSDLKDTIIQAKLRQAGLYKRVFPAEGTPISIGVLNTLPQVEPGQFLTMLQKDLQLLKFSSQITSIETIADTARHHLDRGIKQLQQKGSHIIVGIFADGEHSQPDMLQWNVYDSFKLLTIGSDLPNQVVNPLTMQNNFALGNISLGILSKLGNIPYVLATPLPYADVVVGIDIARRRKNRLEGSINATATTRVYQNTGEFLQYAINDTLLEGETIPAHVLHTLFPPSIFTGKRVVIHRDGPFRGDEKKVLKSWATQLGSQFHLVELLKSGTPRLYQFLPKTPVGQPTKGSAFKLNAYEAFLVSSLPPFHTATPSPLHIRSEDPFLIEQAIHSVLALTQLHYGSLRAPRLPVTIHFSDEIAYLALKGIKPKSLEGSRLFWL